MKKQVMPIEQAEAELIELFDAMSIDTDIDSMLDDDRKDFESKLRTLSPTDRQSLTVKALF